MIPPELWVVLDDLNLPDYACTYPEGAHEHITDAMDFSTDEEMRVAALGKWRVVKYIPAPQDAAPQDAGEREP